MVIEYLLGDFGRWESVLEVQKLYATNYIPVPSPLEEDRVRERKWQEWCWSIIAEKKKQKPVHKEEEE